MAALRQALSAISIHALLAESDGGPIVQFNVSTNYISIHALLAESDGPGSARLASRFNFYPRSPCGERQSAARLTPTASRNFYPRSPCGERQANAVDQILPGHISIHALLAESDNSSVNTADQEARFLSTLSLRRATGLDGRFKL